VLHKKLY